METVKLSKRLKKAAEYALPTQPIADIGSDHAYLPIYLIQRGVVPQAIAGEVAEGPLENAQDTVNAAQLNDKISVRLGDGLSVLNDEDEVGTVFICGMGGLLIKSILEAGEKADNLPVEARLVLQPNNKEKELREFLTKQNYQIIEEEIIEENNKIYEIIVAESTANKVQYTNEQLTFGPRLLKRKPDSFLKKWQNILVKKQKILANMKNAKHSEKAQDIEKEINLIEKVIE